MFPYQAFLSYYHILEYYFLRVSDEITQTSLKAHLNSPLFNTNYENLNKIVAIVKKCDSTSDEKQMLKAVLNKFVPEDDLVEYIVSLEKHIGNKQYSDPKKKIFGEHASIKLEKGHALNNTAKILKKIRDALVHSSDRHNREDCFMPFSESESIVFQYMPIIKFIAEKIIYSTAEQL